MRVSLSQLYFEVVVLTLQRNPIVKSILLIVHSKVLVNTAPILVGFQA